jgi:hypothetical protein
MTPVTGLAWAIAITLAEGASRSVLRSRSRAWLVAYPLVGLASALSRGDHRGPGTRSAHWLGVPLAVAGYPAGCALLRHRPEGPPPDPFGLEVFALAAAVAPVEEATWGRLVERRLGIAITSMLFAAKHVVIDRRPRRALGLAVFWIGLGLVRRRSPRLALGLHVALNAAGVVTGHLSGRDRF